MTKSPAELNTIPLPGYAPRAVEFDPEALYIAVDRARRTRRIKSMREVCRQIGTNTPSTISRLGQGGSLNADMFIAIMAWLGETDVSPYTKPVQPEGAAKWPDPVTP